MRATFLDQEYENLDRAVACPITHQVNSSMHTVGRLNQRPPRLPRGWEVVKDPPYGSSASQCTPPRKIVVVRHRLQAKLPPPPPPVDLTALCLEPPSDCMNCVVVPKVGYTDLENVPDLLHSGVSSESSSSVVTNVDDGLSAWGLPKVISEPYDVLENHFEADDSSLTMVQATPEQPLKKWQLLCIKVVVLVYTAILIKKFGTKVPKRYSRPSPKLDFGTFLRMVC